MEQVNNTILPDGHRYSGYGIHNGISFVPNGYGMKNLGDINVRGNFIKGHLNGPAIFSDNTQMLTLQMKQDKGEGWGMSIDSGQLVEFGVYHDTELKVNLLNTVEWYFDKMKLDDRKYEPMMNIYTSKIDGSITDLHIGYTGKNYGDCSLMYMGFHFLNDGSLWVGNTANRKLTGELVKFGPDGHIQIGEFVNKELVRPMDIQELIDDYYGTYQIHFEDNPFLEHVFGGINEKHPETEKAGLRHKYDNIKIDISKNYFLQN